MIDALEVARQAAADLHAQLVTEGKDPWRPYEFAVAAARHRDIDINVVLPGASSLDGAQATFIPADRLIAHEDAGTAFERAFLVAHEIGHADLGDDRDDAPAPTIDPARPAEPSPVGLDRVVDYSRRQRREIQMDLFARELLLPREVARRLHVEENLSASDIAQRLGAPFDVVAQQLFDALLLPRIELAPHAALARTPNDLQRRAVEHRGPAYLLEAGPGTGKTQTLISRVESLLADGVDPVRILLLTFSNKAAGEMADRIAVRNRDAAAAMWIGTFHAFGLDLIRRFPAECGLPEDPRLMDRTDAVDLLEEEFPALGLVHYRNIYDPTDDIGEILAAISRAKDEVVDDAEYARLAQAMIDKSSSEEERTRGERAVEVARVYAAYEKLKRERKRVDFGDLVALPVRLLEGNAAVRAHLQGLYDHVLVDEYQDVNRSSVRLLTALRPDGRNLWVVGDAKQSIYRFRGASSFNVARFEEDFPGGIRGRLKVNYRSVREIVDTFSGFARGMAAGDANSGLESDRAASGHNPELRLVDQSDDQTVAVAEAIAELHAAGHRFRDQAVLCTGNDRLSALGHDLERLGVPVLFLGSLFERAEVKDLLAFLSLLVDRRVMGLLRLACWPEFVMPLADVAAVVDHLRSVEDLPGQWCEKVAQLPELSPEGKSGFAGILAALDGFGQDAAPWRALATLLLDRTRIAARLARSAEVGDRTRAMAIWQFMNFVRAQPLGQGLPVMRLLDRVRRLVRLGDERDLRQLPVAAQGIDAVRLMTVHGAKGLEFEAVHLVGLNKGTMPKGFGAVDCPPPDGMIEGGSESGLDVLRAGHDEEQECLFYVALSRARDRLLLYAPTRMANRNRRSLSPFIDRLGASLAQRSVTPARSLPAAPGDATVPVQFEEGLQVGDRQITLYESCPRRFFYTHVLQVGGRRTATAFMRLHEVVRTVFKDVIARGETPQATELDGRLNEALTVQGLAEHGYVAQFSALATTMLRYFIASRAGHTPKPPEDLFLTIEGEQIVVRPDEVLIAKGGLRKFRSIQTRQRRSTEGKDVGSAAFVLAAKAAFPDAIVEMVHLSDGTAEAVPLTPKELEGRRTKLTDFMAGIKRGEFPARPAAQRCSGCPAFFACGEVPVGALRKKL